MNKSQYTKWVANGSGSKPQRAIPVYDLRTVVGRKAYAYQTYGIVIPRWPAGTLEWIVTGEGQPE